MYKTLHLSSTKCSHFSHRTVNSTQKQHSRRWPVKLWQNLTQTQQESYLMVTVFKISSI